MSLIPIKRILCTAFCASFALLPVCSWARGVLEPEVIAIQRMTLGVIAAGAEFDRDSIEKLFGARFQPIIKKSGQPALDFEMQIPGTLFMAYWSSGEQSRYLSIHRLSGDRSTASCLQRPLINGAFTGWTARSTMELRGLRYERHVRPRVAISLATDADGCVVEFTSYSRNDDQPL
ncbi:hypothetical protein [Pseudoduganella rhizocola]|uniref:hypothetical protein n=1 Tax=Pseudoduganella rhizocola TaxID=3382643 RepID=UPI0038B56EC0